LTPAERPCRSPTAAPKTESLPRGQWAVDRLSTSAFIGSWRSPGGYDVVAVQMGGKKRYLTLMKLEEDQHNLERRANAKSRILSLAKLLLSGQLGVIAASRELGPLRHEVEAGIAEVLVTFAGIDSETGTLPIGEVRQHWGPEALDRKDREIREAEEFYRDTAMQAATRLLQLLEVPS
jgi:hypothetical protein